ncbi:MAG TPA: hypothetical protein VKD28_15530 [Gemmatimonadales bacterium]|nr:hypothetical protein [Gemmatimonadales bacterium]
MNDAKNGDARLESLAKRLGASAAERLDVEATARKVLAGLRERPAARRTWIAEHWLRIAAAIVLLIGGAIAVRRIVPVDSGNEHSHLVADDLGDLNAEELRAVLVQFDEILGSDSVVSDSSDLRELDAQELRAVLRSLEG